MAKSIRGSSIGGRRAPQDINPQHHRHHARSHGHANFHHRRQDDGDLDDENLNTVVQIVHTVHVVQVIDESGHIIEVSTITSDPTTVGAPTFTFTPDADSDNLRQIGDDFEPTPTVEAFLLETAPAFTPLETILDDVEPTLTGDRVPESIPPAPVPTPEFTLESEPSSTELPVVQLPTIIPTPSLGNDAPGLLPSVIPSIPITIPTSIPPAELPPALSMLSSFPTVESYATITPSAIAPTSTGYPLTNSSGL
jgi:hypothetical protein